METSTAGDDVDATMDHEVIETPANNEEQQPSRTAVVEEESQPPRRRKTVRGDIMNTLHRPIFTHCGENNAVRVLPQNTLPTALKVHPKGFRVLSGRSPIERGLLTYFRLPVAPSGQRLRDIKRVQRMLKMKGRRVGTKPNKKLDGWALLHASNVADPEDATEAVMTDSGMKGVLQDEMSFFSNLEYLDVGENQIQLHELKQLRQLEELHLHCSQLATLQVPSDSFQNLETLNLSFNNFSDPKVLTTLSCLPALVRLDLSGNKFTTLPDTIPFKSLQKLALEGNQLSGDDVFRSLGKIETLQEINLNNNKLARVVKEENAFLSLTVVGLSQNAFSYFEDLYPLVSFAQLQRVVLWGNPVASRSKDLRILLYELSKANIQAYLEGPVPKNRKLGEFYVANTKNMIKVSELQRATLAKKDATVPPVKVEEDASNGHTSFFITEPGAELGQSMSPKKSTVRKQRSSPTRTTQPFDGATRPWFSLDAEDCNGREYENEGGGSGSGLATSAEVDIKNDSMTPPCDDQTVEELLQRIASPAQTEDTLRRKPSTLKGAYTELRLALRAPLTNPVGTQLVRRGRHRPGNFVNYLDNTNTAHTIGGRPSSLIHPTPPASSRTSKLPPLE